MDTLAPETGISSGPPASTSSTSASIAFASNDAAARFECRFDAAAFAACASPASIAGLANGSHVFEVHVDNASNAYAGPATFGWVVDTVAPDTSITGGPSGSSSRYGDVCCGDGNRRDVRVQARYRAVPC